MVEKTEAIQEIVDREIVCADISLHLFWQYIVFI
jgi:hypothetical protein